MLISKVETQAICAEATKVEKRVRKGKAALQRKAMRRRIGDFARVSRRIVVPCGESTEQMAMMRVAVTRSASKLEHPRKLERSSQWCATGMLKGRCSDRLGASFLLFVLVGWMCWRSLGCGLEGARSGGFV